jgi:hypothetical protein
VKVGERRHGDTVSWNDLACDPSSNDAGLEATEKPKHNAITTVDKY